MTSAETLLATLESQPYGTGAEGLALADLAAVVDAINQELGAEPADARIRKLQQWVDRLYQALRRVAEQIHASGFSISVGAPVGVSVGVQWEV